MGHCKYKEVLAVPVGVYNNNNNNNYNKSINIICNVNILRFERKKIASTTTTIKNIK